MLINSGLGNEFWGFAVFATAHIMNRMPSRVHMGKSPYEICRQTKPTVGHLQIFGCVTHVHIPIETQRKLERKSVPCILFGNAENQGHRVYKLYSPRTKKTIT